MVEAHARDLDERVRHLPTLAYEPIDVKRMELPPGWRGRREGLHRPSGHAGRQAEVDALKAKFSGADRFAVQQALMPYEQWLPQYCVAVMSASTSASAA